MKYKEYAVKLVKLTWHLSKSFYILSTLRAFTMALKAFVAVYGLSLIIEGLVENQIETALLYAAIVVGFEVVLRLLEITFDTYIEVARQDLLKKVKVHMAGKLMRVEYKYLEDSDYLDLADKSRFAIDNFQALHGFLTQIIDMINQFIVMLTLLSVVIWFSPLVIIVIILNILLNAYISKHSAKKQIKLFNKLGPSNRKFSYYLDAVTLVKYQKDYRMYALSDMIYDRFDTFLDELCDYMIHFNNVIGKFQMYYTIINYLQITAIYLIIGYMSITQGLGVASYVFLTASALRASTAINGFASKFVRIRENVQLLKPTFDVLDLEDAITKSVDGDKCNDFESIRFEHVSFTYPGSEKVILDDISFTIKKGEKVSIVGLNGAGKTTIVKLICRFFTPSKGTIYWNEKDIQHYNYDSYISQVSAVFQDFKLFALTLKENVDLDTKDTNYIVECLNDVGLTEKLNSLPDKEDSFLSKEYNDKGIEMSGGERQKLAIARAKYKNASLTILDEPTSALDPLAEAEIYKHFNDLVKDKTTIYISHRMSSSVFCDKIIVLDGGQVTHIDTHQNLMKDTKSRYTELFNAQSSYYQ